MTATTCMARAAKPAFRGLDALRPVLDLGIRLWLANVFWKSGLTKLANWDATLALFTYEYRVPLLSPPFAAALATGAELVFPVLLALGLGARLSAAALFVFNCIAVISYPGLNEIGIKDHVYWGILLLVPLLYGPGKFSLDHFIRRKWMG